MQESKLLGKLSPTSPDFLPIVEQLRENQGFLNSRPRTIPLRSDFRIAMPVAIDRHCFIHGPRSGEAASCRHRRSRADDGAG